MNMSEQRQDAVNDGVHAALRGIIQARSLIVEGTAASGPTVRTQDAHAVLEQCYALLVNFLRRDYS